MPIDDILKTKKALDSLRVTQRLNSLEGKHWPSGTVKSVDGVLPDGKGDVSLSLNSLSSSTNTQVIFNDSGTFGGDAGLTYIKGTDTLTVGVLNATTILGDFLDTGAQVFDVKAYGAALDAKTVSDGAITNGAAILTSATGSFLSSDVGKPITVRGAGSTSASLILVTTVLSYQSATQVTLSANATHTVTGAAVYWGTNDSAALLAAIDAANATGNGGVVWIGAGKMGLASTILRKYNNIHVKGAGRGSTTLLGLANINTMGLGSSSTEDTSNYNVTISDLTIDCNFLSQGPALRNVRKSLVENIEVTNTNGTYQLLLGAIANNFNTYPGRDQIVKNSYFTNNTGGSTEMLNLGQGNNISIENCVFDDFKYAVFTWFAENVKISNSIFRSTNVTQGQAIGTNGRGPTSIVNCQFIDSRLHIQSENVDVVGSNFTVTTDDGTKLSDILIDGIYRTVGEAGWYLTYGPEPSDNITITGNTFVNVASNAIVTTPTFNDAAGNKYVGVESLDIIGNTFYKTRWEPDITARNLNFSNNVMVNNKQGSSSISSGFFGGGEKVVFTNNIAYDDQKTTPPIAPTVAINAAAGNLNGAYKYRITFVKSGETLGGIVSSTVSPVSQQVDLTAIPLGLSGTTARKIYRTAAGGADGSQKLVATLSDNTTTTYTDNVADGGLGVAIPTVSTSLATTQTYGANFRNQLEENSLSTSMVVELANNYLQGGIKFFYSSGVQTTPSSTMSISANGNNVGVNPNVIYPLGNITGTATIDRTNGDYQTATLTGNTTITMSGGIIPGDILRMKFIQDGTGSRIITWPSNFKKAGGTLLLSTPASAVDTIMAVYDGTNWNEVSREMNLS